MANILVIDDSETVIKSVKTILSYDKHHIITLEFFVDLARLLKKNQPDLIILDLDMPGFSGINLGTFIREKCNSNIPIIIHSSRSMDDINFAANKIGNAKGIQKAMNLSPLRNMVNEVIAMQSNKKDK